jgi:hypothetical protein
LISKFKVASTQVFSKIPLKSIMSEQPLELEKYVEQMSLLLNLPLTPESRLKVIENLTALARISKLVTEYPLPENIELAPKFEP